MIKEIAKKIIIFIMLSILMLGVFGLSGCTRKASDFSEEEHFKRVTERIEKKFMTDSTNFTKFEVYPLYNENDELEYFLVEFEPYGFVYVLVSDETPFYVSLFGGQRSMYKLSNTEGNSRWSRYTIDESNNQIWETDENGETIVYNKSPYSIANMQEGRRYLLHGKGHGTNYIPAIKVGEKYKNLVSMDEVASLEEYGTKPQSTVYITFIAKKDFDL